MLIDDLMTERFHIDQSPAGDHVADALRLTEPPGYAAIVPLGRGQEFIAGAEYEAARICALLEQGEGLDDIIAELWVTRPNRSLREIAREIRADWQPINDTLGRAEMWLDAMSELDSINDHVPGDNDARTIVCSFIANAGLWDGDTARRIKAELGAMTA